MKGGCRHIPRPETALFARRRVIIVIDGMWRTALAVGVLLAGSILDEARCAHADPLPRTGAPVSLTPDLFERPLCIFVRSMGCPQSPITPEPICNFRYDYYGPDGLYHPVCGDQMFQMLPADVPVVILIHGSFVDFEHETDLVDTFEWIRARAPDGRLLVLCYRWPSTAGCRVVLGSLAICQLAQRSEFHGFYLAQLINQIPEYNSVSLMGHSHGCRMIASALHLLSGGRVDGQGLSPCSWSERCIRVSFFSAAIDHDWLNPGHKYDRAIHRMCWLQNHRHSLDWALLTYVLRYPGSSRALGQTGFTRKDLKKLGPQTAKIHQFNGEGILLWGHGLKSHLKDPAIEPYVLANIFSPCP
jgi:hypothetical protein